MNKNLLRIVNRNLMGWLGKCSEQTVTDSKKLEIIMMSLADLAQALATDGTEASVEDFFREPEST